MTSRRTLLVSAAVLIAFATAGALVLVLRRDKTEPATVGANVAKFRTEPQRAAHRRFPEPGVYVYATDGFEEVDALGGTRHVYPRRSTIAVIGTDCGMRLRWSVLKGRQTTWEVCASAHGWLLRSVAEEHTFFSQTEKTLYRCVPAALLRPRGDRPGAAWRTRCVAGKTLESGSASVVGRETVRVGGEPVEAVHLGLHTLLRRDTRGTGERDWWLDRKNGLPLEVVMRNATVDSSAIGHVHYNERVRLVLTSLVPLR
jgi:hypothetical protein